MRFTRSALLRIERKMRNIDRKYAMMTWEFALLILLAFSSQLAMLTGSIYKTSLPYILSTHRRDASPDSNYIKLCQDCWRTVCKRDLAHEPTGMYSRRVRQQSWHSLNLRIAIWAKVAFSCAVRCEQNINKANSQIISHLFLAAGGRG